MLTALIPTGPAMILVLLVWSEKYEMRQIGYSISSWKLAMLTHGKSPATNDKYTKIRLNLWLHRIGIATNEINHLDWYLWDCNGKLSSFFWYPFHFHFHFQALFFQSLVITVIKTEKLQIELAAITICRVQKSAPASKWFCGSIWIRNSWQIGLLRNDYPCISTISKSV